MAQKFTGEKNLEKNNKNSYDLGTASSEIAQIDPKPHKRMK